MAADYHLSPTTCLLFLSLKYHKLHPDYIHTRLKTLGTAFTLRILLVLVDITDHTASLVPLTKLCVVANLSLFLSWSPPEAGRYLETFKSFEHSAPTAIMGKVDEGYGTRLVEVLTRVRGVNKTDAVTLVSTFGSVRAAVNAAPEEVMMISGWGQQKVGRLERAVREGFRPGGAGGKRKRVEVGIAPPSRRREVAARLGLVDERDGDADKEMEAWMISDDEDALAAVAEFEAAEKERGKAGTTPATGPQASGKGKERELEDSGPNIPPPGKEKEKEAVEHPADTNVGDGIMAALAKMRERR